MVSRYKSQLARDTPSSIRETVGQNLRSNSQGAGYAALWREYGLRRRDQSYLAWRAEINYRFHSLSDKAITEGGCGAFLSTLLSFGCLPVITSSTSHRICIMASQNLRRRLLIWVLQDIITYLSTSSKVSDSVGSINMQVDIGQEHVGGWNP